MATNQHTLLRQWHMLRLLPRAPRRVTVQQICDALAAEDFSVTPRTVQRDLLELSQVFPLTVDNRDKPYGWSWQQDAGNFDLPGLTVPEAMTLKLVEQQLRLQLPPAVLDALQPYFQSADRALSIASGRARSRAWLDKVRTVPPAQSLLPPALDRDCQRTVYDALMHDRQLALSYRKRDAEAPVHYEAVHPLAVIQRGQLVYLACSFGDYGDVRTLAMHRIVGAEMRYDAARRPPGFSVDQFIASGEMDVRTGRPITLRAIFSKKAGEHLFETPLSNDQVLKSLADGRVQLTATIAHTKQLLWWLLAFGDGVEVMAPAQLRREMTATVQRMHAHYSQP